MKIIVVTLHLCLIFYWAASEDPNNLFKQRFIRAGADTAVAGAGAPPPPPNGDSSSKKLPDAAADDQESFIEFLKKIDHIIEMNMRGYELASQNAIADIELSPLEPCTVNTGGFMPMLAFLGRRGIAQNVSNIPTDLEDSVPVILSHEPRCNLRFSGQNSIHNFIIQNDCTQAAITSYRDLIIHTGERFRHAVDDLINNRRLITSMADVFRDPDHLTDEQINSATRLKVPGHTIVRTNEFYNRNKLDIEQQISEASFRVEALRLSLIRMFDELFARRMGWGYSLSNPGVRFMVYIQHLPLFSNCVAGNPKRVKRSINPTSCIAEAKSIDNLNEIIDARETRIFQIIKFSERETNLQKEIQNLIELYETWIDTGMGWFTAVSYQDQFMEKIRMFNIFKHDILVNPQYGPIETKLEIIKDFRNLIKNQMRNSMNWYWFPTRVFNRMEQFMLKFYHGHFPNPPRNNGTVYHDELK